MKALLLDAGGTIVFPDFRRIADEFSKDGVKVEPEALARAEARVRLEMDSQEFVHSTDDAQRWEAYLRRLFELVGIKKIPIDALLRLKRYHDTNNLWDSVPADIPETLKALKERFRLGVVSNANGTVKTLLTRIQLAQYFEIIVDSHEEGMEKPDPRIFQRALERLQVPASDTAYVGDLYHVDILGAQAVGMKPILIDPFDFYKEKPVTRIKALREILTLNLRDS